MEKRVDVKNVRDIIFANMIEKGKERFKIMDDNYCVYIHTNKINGKKYVGQTKHGDNPKEKRWKYGDGYKSCTYFYNAILKYGWNNFEHEIVDKNLTKDEAYSMEQKLISELDTRNPNVGYNIRIGGEENYSLSEIEQLKRIQTLKDTVRENTNNNHLKNIKNDSIMEIQILNNVKDVVRYLKLKINGIESIQKRQI